MKKLRQSFIESASSSNNSKRLWASIRCVSRCRKSSTRSRFSAEDFNSFFVSNFQTHPSNFTDRPTVFSDECNLSTTPFVLSVDETIMQLSKLKCGSSGPDGLSPWTLKLCSDFVASAITFLFNRSLETGIFPDCLKCANVTPIPKCSRPSDVSDFRPISIVSCLSKLFEKLVLKKWILPLVKNRMSPSQFAYVSRPGAGTTPAVTILYHEVLKFLDGKSGAVRLLSIDFAKAFDKITHSAIVDACITFEFDPQLIKWLVSFLSNRFQRVCLDGNVSDWSAVTSGVPQGSVLGPLLFCLVVDSLSPIFPNSSILKYADDVMILHFIRNCEDDRLQAEWNALVDWSETISLPINYSKSQVLDIVTKSRLLLAPISVSSTVFLKNVNLLYRCCYF